ncbi:Gfo/Idh/MocA family protein [Parapedobacter sp. 2B3]|uniref:Gfo/Idh/MocA family protein n=1 Tax=Parapedobacter sp. 2B3 TaxID=3342381 RepID=UPI0035B60A5D
MKVLIVGLGSIAKKHIYALKAVVGNDVEFFALRSSSMAKIHDGVKNIYDIKGLEKYQFDFAIISNPTAFHHVAIQQLLPLQIPLFIEKPLFDSLDYDEMVERITNSPVKTYVACNLRFLNCLAFAQKFLEEHRINEVNVYCGSYLPGWHPGENFRLGYSANRHLGGGVHIDLIHEIDYVYWLFGSPRSVSRFLKDKSSLQIDATDYANYLFDYEAFPINVVLNYFRKDSKRSLEVVCENGTLYVNLLTNECFWNGESVFSSNQRIIDTYTTQIEYFLREVVTPGNSTHFNKINEAYDVLRLCLS